MTSRINGIIDRTERLNNALTRTDVLTDQIGSGNTYNEIANAVNRVADNLERILWL